MNVKVNWTQAQKAAIEVRDMSVIVSAAAGSGKTAVLVERVVSLLTDEKNPVEFENMILATFSKASASEMKHRISQRLGELYKQSKSPFIRRQIQDLPKARISTVHSLCFDLIRENFHTLNFSPNPKIGDEKELEIIRRGAILDVLNKKYEELCEGFRDLSELMSSGNNDNGLITTIEDMYAFLRSYPFYNKWVEEMKEEYSQTDNPQHSKWGKVIIEYALSTCKYIKELLTHALNEAKKDDKVHEGYSNAILSDLEQVNNIIIALTASDWTTCHKLLSNLSFMTLGRVTKCENKHIQNNVKSLRDDSKKLLKDLADKHYFCSKEEFKKEMQFILPLINTLFDTIIEIDELYSELKKEKNLLDFSDLEHLALKLLVTMEESGYKYTETAKMLSEDIYEVLVDEYQDTNYVQDMIFKAITDDGRKLFMVGDVKQSIYGFRQAKPEIFLDKKENFPNYTLKDKEGKIIMQDNFRSRKEITDSINYIFSKVMSKKAGGMDYNEEDALFPAANYPNAKDVGCEVVLLDSASGDNEDSKREVEAKYIAQRISDMISSGYTVHEKGLDRPLRFSDIAILLRSTSNKSDIYQRALKGNGIDSIINLEKGFIFSEEVYSVICFLKIIENPLLDIELTNALISPLFGYTAKDLGRLSLNKTDKPLFVRLKEGKNTEKIDRFFKIYDEISSYTAITPVSELIYMLYDLTNAESVFGMMKNGNAKVVNLRLLSEYASKFDKNGYKGLSSFISFVNKIIDNGSDLAPGSLKNETLEAVKIMSIHKSKGLEFPVVFLADTTKRFNEEDNKKNYLINPDLGFACKRKDLRLGAKYNTMPLLGIRLKNRKEMLDEELRLLYVALTRAKEKLIITATSKNITSEISKSVIPLTKEDKIPERYINNSSSYAQIILSALLHHKDGITLRNECEIISEDSHGNVGEFNIIITNLSNKEKKSDNEDVVENISFKGDEKLLLEIIKRQSYKYPYEEMTKLPTGLAISHIGKDKEEKGDIFSKRPKFLTEQKLTAAERGTAMHKFMQYADYGAAATSLDEEIKRLLSKNYLSEKESESLNITKLKKFFNSTLYNRMENADGMLREYSFFADISGKRLKAYTDEIPENASVALQGIADCILLENGKATIIDYKTDFVSNVDIFKEQYSTQINLYKEIVKSFLGYGEVEAMIYSFYLDDTINI